MQPDPETRPDSSKQEEKAEEEDPIISKYININRGGEEEDGSNGEVEDICSSRAYCRCFLPYRWLW